METDLTRQIVVVHLSDVHFGKYHRFDPPLTAGGDSPDEDSYPTLLAKLAEDLHEEDPGCPVIICNTGDFAETGSLPEFKKAEEFVKQLAGVEVLGRARGISSMFMVPGNHDVQYDSSDVGTRWQQWTDFYNRCYGTNVNRDKPLEFAALHDRIDDLGALILCLNSAIYVEKGMPDQDRGRLDIAQLTKIEIALERVEPVRLASAIKIALIHHHPVLIPALAESKRGYDAVHNSGKLLTILKRFGFHVILHGHKHNPNIFTEDVKSAHISLPDQPILISAGGSIGSIELPYSPRPLNCYNRLTIKWHPNSKRFRIRTITRAVNTLNADGSERLPTRWQWETLREDDRRFSDTEDLPFPVEASEREFNEQQDAECESERANTYKRTRYNLPVVEVVPSLIPEQAYEAVVWIVSHSHEVPQADENIPASVTWSAGKKFEVVTVAYEQDRLFAARLAYWGPMLVQARIQFKDGTQELAHVYARMPRLHEKSPTPTRAVEWHSNQESR